MTYGERVAFWVDVYGMTREEAERQIAAEASPRRCLVDSSEDPAE